MALRKFSGKVVQFWREREYGFVRIDTAARDAVFHLDNFEETTGPDQVTTGTRLEFFLEQQPRGLKAIRLSIAAK